MKHSIGRCPAGLRRRVETSRSRLIYGGNLAEHRENVTVFPWRGLAPLLHGVPFGPSPRFAENYWASKWCRIELKLAQIHAELAPMFCGVDNSGCIIPPLDDQGHSASRVFRFRHVNALGPEAGPPSDTDGRISVAVPRPPDR